MQRGGEEQGCADAGVGDRKGQSVIKQDLWEEVSSEQT